VASADRLAADRAEGVVLPTPLTSLIGRDVEVRAVLDLLDQPFPRLLTLTGPGGAGKTRLALAASARLLDRFADGVFFVDLSALRDPALVPSTIARSLGVHETGDEPLMQSIQRHLAPRAVLLVLDNFEQLLPAAPAVATLLGACPHLKVLVTSRAALRLSGEHELPVPPLAVPDLRQLPEIDALTQYEAVALFLQRAQAVRPDFQVTTANAAAIAELCARLDGLPLAIELAAARVKLLSPQALLARLGNRLALLTGGSRDRPARQQTLRGTIDWSYELLDPGAQRLFMQLAVFAGGATLESIEAVCAGAALPTGVLDGLSSLTDESLLRQGESPSGETHFDMLETIREYALERLEASGEAEVIRERHARHYLALVEAAEAGLKGAEQRAWLGRLALEDDNARAALAWALQRHDATLALRLAGALGPYWQMHDHLTEGQAWMEQALALEAVTAPDVRARALTAGGGLAFLRGDTPRAISWQQESLELWRQLGDSFGLAAALHNLARAVHYQARYEEAERLYQETLALRRQIDDRRGLAATLNSLGVLMRDRGDDPTARALYEESLGLYRELQDLWGQALLLNNMARITRDANELAETHALCVQSLDLFAALGDKHGLTWVVSNLAIVAQRQRDAARAAQLTGATEAVRETLGAAPLSLSPGERAIYEASISRVRTELGPAGFASLQAAGRAMSLDEILAFARSDSTQPAAPLKPAPAETPPASRPAGPTRTPGGKAEGDRPSPLTRREVEVAALVARGLTNKQIAAELTISEGTVGVHLEHIFGKLELRSRAQLAAWVVERRQPAADTA
jgi:predicted ATPase/DNA-binding CsgD family transcriptional regulator